MVLDVGTGLTVLGSAIGSKNTIEKILGPTADYLGSGLKNWTENRINNVGRIFEKASEKLGSKIDTPGSVPPRVLKEVLEEGSYCDDELTAEYFGGVLASSRTGISRDDRAASYLKLTSDLSTYQIRFHYISYISWRDLFLNSGLRPTFSDDLRKMWIFLPATFLDAAMDFTDDEPGPDIVLHCTTGLERHDLITCAHWGDADHINNLNTKRGWATVSEPGICIHPTQFGIDYWLWAVGLGNISRTDFLDKDLVLPKPPNINIPSGVLKLVSPP